ncbi:MAG: MFS transporter [Flavobacteriaceae bacterium]|nr:MFS transporter [Flavobacteriaceae bacterium]
MQDPKISKGSFLNITLLILSGELIYMLPYVLARVFRPTFLDVFRLTNFELGSLFSVYGIVALLSYLYGGVLADKFLPRKLIALSLFSTSLGGLIMATFPSYLVLQILFGYWGFTTVFLFWGAMIKATRLWGGSLSQGQAFGFLDGGRGLVAASMGSIGVFIFSFILTTDIKSANLIERQEAFRYVILFTSFMVALIGFLVLVYMKSEGENEIKDIASTNSFSNIKSVMKIPSVWLLMIIIISAYVGYKLTDIYSLYASDVMLYDQIQAAEVGALQLYLRPIVCVIIGLLADKTSGVFWIIAGFIIMLIGAIIFASGVIQSNMNFVFFLSLIIIAIGTYAARALYFAIFQEGYIPLAYMGTAVGIISVVGYTPDVFASPIMGYLLDSYPGIVGHQYVFTMLVLFSILGLFASIKFAKLVKAG